MKKIGICLSGGGARGAYQIGALKALEDLGILQQTIAFSGSSIGAINATFAVASSLDVAKEIWFNVPEDPLGHNPSIITTVKNQRLRLIDSGLFSIKKLNELLNENIDFELLKSSNIFIGISDTGDADKGFMDLLKSTFKHYVQKESQVLYIPLREFDKTMQISTLVASCSIPIVFPPVITNSRKYRDGGYFDNTPVQPLIDFGCDEIICITISALSSLRAIKKKYKNIEIHEIRATKRLGKVLDFSSSHSRKIYEFGYDDTVNYFRNEKI